MADGPQLRTQRLLMRRWRAEDLDGYAALNADPAVMEYFVCPLSRAESAASIERFESGFEAHRFGLWALELLQTGSFIGFTGLSVPSFQAPFMPAIEVGWRLAHAAWGHGYASEAALAALRFGFEEAGLNEIVSFTSPLNTRSWSVMERIGMRRDESGDFEHPKIAEKHPLRPHLLYRISREAWLAPQFDCAAAAFNR